MRQIGAAARAERDPGEGCRRVNGGAGTARHDDPLLTVRHCEGRNPVRAVIDAERRLGPDYRIFQDDSAPTLLLCG